MTAEERRDRWLKRILPGLVVGAIYATFVGPLLVGKADKARQEYEALMSKGISPAALPGMERQIDSLQAQIAKLKQDDAKVQGELSKYAGFLAQGGAANGTSDQLAKLFAEHRLRVIEEKLEEKPAPESFPKSLRDTQEWLKTALNLNDGMTLLEIHFAGSYVDTYAALAVLADGKINALPVSLTMREWKEAGRTDTGMLEWRLKLWI
jgi:hypothetical protein